MSWEQGLTGKELLENARRPDAVRGQRAAAAGPRAHSEQLQQQALEGLPRGGGSRLGEKLASPEAMVSPRPCAMYDGDEQVRSTKAAASPTTGASTSAPAGSLDRAASKGVATSPAATALRQLYKNYDAEGLYADAFDSQTEAKAELDWNKYQAGGVHALHAIEQTVSSCIQDYKSRTDDAGAIGRRWPRPPFQPPPVSGTILMAAGPGRDQGRRRRRRRRAGFLVALPVSCDFARTCFGTLRVRKDYSAAQ